MLILYVDDMLIVGHSKRDIADLKQKLSSQFDMKDLGDAHHILGMRITRDQKKGLLYLLKKSTCIRCLSISICRVGDQSQYSIAYLLET